jgi:hypothetical protein
MKADKKGLIQAALQKTAHAITARY